jgi:hypothetical protein
VNRRPSACALGFLSLALAAAGQALTPDQRQALDRITADSLRGHVSFLASDLLEGRSTPSRGLDLAADYIATQFRRAGLEPAGGDGYFQRVNLSDVRPRGAPGRAQNVAGLLRGSDPALRDTYVLLTAHYDHRPMARRGEDRIFNGANDDASGTASVMEVAAALSALAGRPGRSVLFVAFFGEESGQLGSRYYVGHPLVPLEKTVASLNLELMGRTDGTDGPRLGSVFVTGFELSGVPRVLERAGELAGIRVLNDRSSDAYFTRGDNHPLAEAGVPAHSLAVALMFPDYHKVTDTWDKLDYANMAAVCRAVALGILTLASEAPPPRWNESHEPARRYAEAAARLRR